MVHGILKGTKELVWPELDELLPFQNTELCLIRNLLKVKVRQMVS
ncbi:hypothetical protein LXL04_012287 [Taraxacum kok-saghyz]